MKKNKNIKVKAIIFLISLILCLGFTACAQNISTNKNQLKFPEEEAIEKEEKISLDIDGTGLFNKVKGIESIEPDVLLPDCYSGLAQTEVTEKGVRISASVSGAEVFYTGVIDLEELSGDILNFEVLYNDIYEMRSVEVYLIDIYDSSNYFSVYWKYHPNLSQPYSFMLVSVNGKELGLNNENNTNLPREEYGSINWTCGFNEGIDIGYPLARGCKHVPFGFTFDTETNSVRSRIEEDGSYYTVLDIDDPAQVGESVFKGFTTNEVYVKIKFREIVKNGGIVIEQIAGRSMNQEIEKLPSNNIKLDMDYDFYDNNLPEGAIGYSFPLPVPIKDDILQSDAEISCKITKDNKDYSNKITDNIFYPEESGNYLLTYISKDVNGLENSRSFDLKINNSPADITVNLLYDENSYNLFSNAKLPVSESSGGYGKLKTEISYFYNGREVFPDSAGKIYLDEKGLVKAVAVVTDYIGVEKVQEVEIKVVDTCSLILSEGIKNAYKAGSEVILPSFQIKDYSFNENEEGFLMATSIYVDGVKLDDDRLWKVPNDKDKATITIKGENGRNKFEKEYSVNIIHIEDENSISEYLVAENMLVKDTEKGVSLKAIGESNSISFPEFVSTEFMAFEFETIKGKGYFEYIELCFEDCIFDSIKIALRLYKNGNSTLVCARDKDGNFGLTGKLDKNLDENTLISLYYKNSEKMLYNEIYADIIKISFCENGDYFDGFKSNAVKVNISYGLKGDYSPEIILKKLGNQSFSSLDYEFGDIMGPEFAFSSSIQNCTVKKGSSVIVPAADAYDVLQGKYEVTVSVKKPDNSMLYEDVKADKSFELNITEYGIYTITYKTYDALYNLNEISYIIEAKDNIAPVLNVNGKIDENYKVGTEIKIPDFTATDDYSVTDKIVLYVVIRDPDMKLEIKNGKDKYQLWKVGRYEIKFCAIDENYNIASLTYNFEVEG